MCMDSIRILSQIPCCCQLKIRKRCYLVGVALIRSVFIFPRFSSDLYTVDDSLPFILNIFLATLFGVIGPIIVTVYSLPFICLLLFPLSILYFSIQRRYRPASRDLKRIGSVALSPIYAHFTETLTGVTTIRAMQSVARFTRENESRLEASLKGQ